MGRVFIDVLGGGGEVGRAGFFIHCDRCSKGVLLDYGVNFDEEGHPQFPGHVRPIDVAGVVVSHAHLDHIGAVPLLYVSSAPLAVMTRPTLEIGELLIRDFMKLSGYYIDYEESELLAMKEHSLLVDYGEEITIGDYVVMMTSAGHILGSGLTYLDIDGHGIMYTGDVNTIQTWTLGRAELWPKRVDTLIIESTYGSSLHPPRHLTERKLVEAIEEVLDAGGTVLIPAFSVGRSQEVISLLAAEFPTEAVFLDGMGRAVTEIYLSNKRFLRDPGFFEKAVSHTRIIRGWEDRRKAWRRPGVIVSSAGMLKGGPALYYLKKIAGNPRNAVFLVSYQSIDSPGHEILETGRVESLGLEIKARLQWFDLSSHAGRDGLLNIAVHYKATVKNIVIIHGEDDARNRLAEEIRNTIGNDVNIYMPRNGERIVIEN